MKTVTTVTCEISFHLFKINIESFSGEIIFVLLVMNGSQFGWNNNAFLVINFVSQQSNLRVTKYLLANK